MVADFEDEKGSIARYLGRIASHVESIDKRLDEIADELRYVDGNGFDSGYGWDEAYRNGGDM